MGPAERDAEAGHHFVEDQQRAVFRRQLTQRLQEIRRRADEAHVADDRFQNDAGDLVAVFCKGRGQIGDVVIAKTERVFRRAGRHPRRVRNAERCGRTSRGDEQAIDVPVVVAAEFDDDVAAREPAG